jgi:hypothetical protein
MRLNLWAEESGGAAGAAGAVPFHGYKILEVVVVSQWSYLGLFKLPREAGGLHEPQKKSDLRLIGV